MNIGDKIPDIAPKEDGSSPAICPVDTIENIIIPRYTEEAREESSSGIFVRGIVIGLL